MQAFGSYRGAAPTQTVTDRDFTGQPQNRTVGLLYYQARFYVPGNGRFASADSIVPDPTNPQQYNRYSYVLNNALRYTDPTGHSCYNPSLGSPCVLSDGTGNTVSGQPASTLPVPPAPLIKFDGYDGHTWTNAEKAAVHAGAWRVARALYEAGGGQFSSPRDAFLSVYGGTVTFSKTGQSCAAATGATFCFAQVQSSRLVHVYTDIDDNSGNSRIPGPNTSDRWAVHELGHAFESRVNGRVGTWGHVRSQLPDNLLNRNGFAGGFPGWQQSQENTPGEIFADMFLGWAYGQWATDRLGTLTDAANLKADFMTTNMSVWLEIAARP